MPHELTPVGETATDVLFECSNCGGQIGFNKTGVGDPAATQVDGVWVAPENPDQWMGPCT